MHMRTCGMFLADIALLELLFPQRIRDADHPLTRRAFAHFDDRTLAGSDMDKS